MMKTKISILVPVYNSEPSLPLLLSTIDEQRIKYDWDLELLLIEDGGKDNSFETIVNLKKQYPFIRGFRLSRNFGQQAALSIGLREAKGDYIAIIDDDLQDPPALLQSFFEKLDQGHDVVYGVRKNRKENFFKIFAYGSFYRILSSISEIQVPLDSGDFCALKRRVLESMIKLNEKQPYIREIRSWVGYNQYAYQYDRPERTIGESTMTLRKLIRFAFDGIYSFSDLPLKLTSIIGSIVLVSSITYSFFLLINYLLNGSQVQGFTTIALLVIFFGSLNMIFLGIVGEYISRTYSEVKNRPHAIIQDRI